MCGIIGYLGKRKIVPVLIDGLKRLEYRGYDSSGLTIAAKDGLITVKRKGRISELENASKNIVSDLEIQRGIAHTRWATHGEPSQINAHPHLDSNEKIAIVHNGIVENYKTLKKMLSDEGFTFKSETDSEVIANLIAKFYSVQNSLEDATVSALKLIEGTYGLAVINNEDEKMIVARKGSPLIIGIGNEEMFVASDVSAILRYTRKMIYLDDNEIAILTNKGYEIKSISGDLLDKKVHEIKWSLDQIEKKGFKHFMLKEIFEQPEAIENTIRGRIKNNQIKLDVDVDLSQIKRIVITACGTSWHSALIGKFMFEELVKIPVEVDYASEFRYRNPLVDSESLVIVISQSGETADTLAALREAKRKGAKTLGIVNVVGSTIAREVYSGIYIHVGPEIGVASTKAFTGQVVDLLLLALYFKQKNSPLDSNLLSEILLLPKKIAEILKSSENIRDVAKKFNNAHNTLYLGRGINFPVALEGALKLKEISYIHAEGYPAAEMKHGPIALIDQNMPVVFVSPTDKTYEKILSNMEEVKARGGNIIAVINEVDEKIKSLADNIILVPKSENLVSPILNVIPLQLLAYHIADLKNIDVDKPRNLAKSVTVE